MFEVAYESIRIKYWRDLLAASMPSYWTHGDPIDGIQRGPRREKGVQQNVSPTSKRSILTHALLLLWLVRQVGTDQHAILQID